jgi:hypothetical protein
MEFVDSGFIGPLYPPMEEHYAQGIVHGACVGMVFSVILIFGQHYFCNKYFP